MTGMARIADNAQSEAAGTEEPVGVNRSASPHEELHEHIRGRGIISNIALGLSDGLVTNIAFLAGFAGAVSPSGIVIVRLAGISAMLAGAVSMFFGGVLAARSELDLFKADARRESLEIENEPEEERAELRAFYLEKGLTQEEADMVVGRITSDKKKWLKDILAHELHIHEEELKSPVRTGASIGLAFLAGAFVPLLPYLVIGNLSEAIPSSIFLSLIFLFFAGSWKGRIVGKGLWKSGTEMLLVGAVASLALYIIGILLVFV